MRSESNIFFTWISAIRRALDEDGFNAVAVMSRAGIDAIQLTKDPNTVNKHDLMRLWKSVTQTTDDDVYCLRCMQYACDPYINAMVTSAQACASVKDALNMLLKYYPVVLASTKISAEVNDTLKIHIKPNTPDAVLSYAEVDITFGMIIQYGTQLLIRHVRPLKISLSRPEPNNAEVYEAHFNCPVLYRQNENFIELPIAVLNDEIPGANQVLFSHLDGYLEQQIAGGSHACFKDQVKHELLTMLPNGTPKLQDIARRLNLSERSLQRKLSLSGLSYSTLLNSIRIELAKKHLNDTNEPVETIATRLGFTESANFIRFFKQHTGKTPQGYVKQITLET